MKVYRLKRRILVPLALAFAAMMALFFLTLYWTQQKEMVSVVDHNFAAVERLFAGLLKGEASMMASSLHILLRDKELEAALMAKDRKALLDQTATMFGHMLSAHGITHLYFTGPDAVNILRVHQPGRYGDKIDRFTTVQASQTHKLSWGIELGPLGTFTLRVVEPWYHGDELIGFVELGAEIEHITRKIHDMLGVELYVFIEKQFLNREDWGSGMRMLGRVADWEQFPSVVLVDKTQDEFPDALVRFVPEAQHISRETDVAVSFKERNYRSKFIHLHDASGRPVGDMVVMMDVTNMVSGLRANVLVVGSFCMVVAAFLIILFYWLIGGAEGQIAAAREALLRVTKAVESTGDAIIISNSSGEHLFQNPASVKMFGYSDEDLRAAGGSVLLQTDSAVAIEVGKSLAAGRPWHGETGVRTREGGVTPVSLRADVIRGKDGEVAGFVSIYSDVTGRRQAEEERETLITELQAALASVKTLRGLLPICSACKKIRDDQGYWKQLEGYIRDHSEAEFTHSLCPECATKVRGISRTEKT